MLPLTHGSIAYLQWLQELENPEEECYAHKFLYAYYEYISSAVSKEEESWDPSMHFLNKADRSLARIFRNRECPVRHSSVLELTDDTSNQCSILAECLKRCIVLFFNSYGSCWLIVVSSDPTLKWRALACIRPILKHNIYLCKLMLKQISTAAVSHPHLYANLLDEIQGACETIQTRAFGFESFIFCQAQRCKWAISTPSAW